MINIREIILKHLASVVEEHSTVPFPDDITDNTMLDEFWLDSVAFAALISSIEEDLGYVPPDISEGIEFPDNFGEFVRMYEEAAGATRVA